MNTGKKIILGIIIVIVGFFAIGFISFAVYEQIDPEGHKKYLQELDERQAEREKEQRIELRNEELRNRLPTNVSEITPSKMGNGYWQSDEEEAYYDHAEKLLSEYLLSYKGQDNSGWTMSEMLLVEFAEECGSRLYLNSYGFNVRSWISDYSEKQIDMVVWIDNKAGDLCPALSFEIYVKPHSSKILSGDEVGQNVLKVLDDVSERIILGGGNNPLYIPDDVSLDDLKALVRDLSK